MFKARTTFLLSVSDYAYLFESNISSPTFKAVLELIDKGIQREAGGDLRHDNGQLESTICAGREELYQVYLINRLLNGAGYDAAEINSTHQISITMKYMNYQMAKTIDLSSIKHDSVIERLAKALGVDTNEGMAKQLLKGMGRCNLWFQGGDTLTTDWFIFPKKTVPASDIKEWFRVELNQDIDINELKGTMPAIKRNTLNPVGAIYEVDLQSGDERHFQSFTQDQLEDATVKLDMLAQSAPDTIYYRWVYFKI